MGAQTNDNRQRYLAYSSPPALFGVPLVFARSLDVELGPGSIRQSWSNLAAILFVIGTVLGACYLTHIEHQMRRASD